LQLQKTLKNGQTKYLTNTIRGATVTHVLFNLLNNTIMKLKAFEFEANSHGFEEITIDLSMADNIKRN
jgi:hypothetical protein